MKCLQQPSKACPTIRKGAGNIERLFTAMSCAELFEGSCRCKSTCKTIRNENEQETKKKHMHRYFGNKEVSGPTEEMDEDYEKCDESCLRCCSSGAKLDR